MRSLRTAADLLALLVLGASAASSCASSRVPEQTARAAATDTRRPGDEAVAHGTGVDAARVLAARLPSDAERCSVTATERLRPDVRALVGPISQSERLAFRLAPEVIAHARAERSSEGGARVSVEYVLFAEDVRALVKRRLAELLERPVAWDEAAPATVCEGEPTCRPIVARFLDAHTLRLGQGTFGEASDSASPCLALLARHPDALEVSARSTLREGTALRGVEVVLAAATLHGEPGIERTVHKHYASPEEAARTLRAARMGHEELASLAGLPAYDLGQQEGASVLVRAFASFADLQLLADDRERSARALADARSVDRADARALRAKVDVEAKAEVAWADVTAEALARGARRSPRAPLHERLALGELPRLFGWLAHTVASEVALQVVVVGGSDAAGLARARVLQRAAHAQEGRFVLAETRATGRPGLVLAARADDDAGLRALGRALVEATHEGPLELLIGLDRRTGEPGPTLRLAGRREGDTLLIEQASRALARSDWPTLERLLAAPLRGLAGAAYPPDELVVIAEQRAEAGAIVDAAERAERVRCTLEGLTVRCRGPLADATAARRALLSIVRARLAGEAARVFGRAE